MVKVMVQNKIDKIYHHWRLFGLDSLSLLLHPPPPSSPRYLCDGLILNCILGKLFQWKPEWRRRGSKFDLNELLMRCCSGTELCPELAGTMSLSCSDQTLDLNFHQFITSRHNIWCWTWSQYQSMAHKYCWLNTRRGLTFKLSDWNHDDNLCVVYHGIGLADEEGLGDVCHCVHSDCPTVRPDG